jgi:hypothetical protein
VQANNGSLYIELQDTKGLAGARLIFDSDGILKVKAGARFRNIGPYKASELYALDISFNTATRFFTVAVNGKDPVSYLFFNPVSELSRIVFRTGAPREFPTPDTPADQTFDVKDSGESDVLAAFRINAVKTWVSNDPKQ